MKIHFIAIGGSAMHNLAIALKLKGYSIKGSDDAINDPSRSRLKKYNLLPQKEGWFSEKITSDIDAVVLGMHAKDDNPELLKAREIGLKIYSYPEFIFNQSKDKIRIVIGGSHGKTSITSLVLHVLRTLNIESDYMVGAQLDGFEVMVKLTDTSKYIVLEGDEYLSSALDLRPKFHLYKPHIALISGIAWDHINVFKTFENYLKQFEIFINSIEENGTLVYNELDPKLKKLVSSSKSNLNYIPYSIPKHKIIDGISFIDINNELYRLKIFGDHNLQNISGALNICKVLGVKSEDFYNAITSFNGASNRLELVYKSSDTIIFKDFAHSPSKVKATTEAVFKQFPNRKLISFVELHTYSSLNPLFLEKYRDTLKHSDECYIYYSEKNMRIKRLEPIDSELIIRSFNHSSLTVIDNYEKLNKKIYDLDLSNSVLLMMSSGKFGGLDIDKIKKS
ncbi:MAG: peptidoglycan synthetase [Flavobacteriaceae bacterium]|nr:peptidoglycan synthetase [Flavobacteriaceae bacterium]|tara:strand:+ start:4597 stop:5946 length:1350 start_codon:yes stop_codon:yes gene_type:complete